MSGFTSCAYTGSVVHKRLRPREHAFTYRVFTLCLDLDELDCLDARLRLFSRNRWNLMSFRDADFGDGRGCLAAQIRGVLEAGGLGACGHRITLVCYPRLLGFVFNPLSVYFCHDAEDRLGVIVYEVSNTFGERKRYIIPVGASVEGGVAQACAKEMYVSPFTSPEARYSFHVHPPGAGLVIGVDIADTSGPVLKTHFRGARRDLSDRDIAVLLLRYPLMTLKVVAGIHFEALRLWWKGVPRVVRHVSPRYSETIVTEPMRVLPHAGT